MGRMTGRKTFDRGLQIYFDAEGKARYDSPSSMPLAAVQSKLEEWREFIEEWLATVEEPRPRSFTPQQNEFRKSVKVLRALFTKSFKFSDEQILQTLKSLSFEENPEFADMGQEDIDAVVADVMSGK